MAANAVTPWQRQDVLLKTVYESITFLLKGEAAHLKTTTRTKK